MHFQPWNIARNTIPIKQKPAEAEFLRVDKHFKAHGPEGLKRLYAYKAAAEKSNLKAQATSKPRKNHKVKG